MTDLVAIVPSRGRPEAARAVAAAFEKTCTADTELLFAIDMDDPERGGYGRSLAQRVRLVMDDSTSMVDALNRAAVIESSAFAVAFMGDDHRPRSTGWDRAYLDALHELGTGIVYGNDLLQGRNLPTQAAMTSDIVRALGYMSPPVLTHMYVDNFWLSLGNEAGCIRYLPNVIVEHLHPMAGKSEWDANYDRVNSSGMYERDEAAFRTYITDGRFDRDVAKVKALRGDAPHVGSGPGVAWQTNSPGRDG